MLQLALDRPTLTAHPEEHPRQDGRGDDRCQPFDGRADRERQLPHGEDDDQPGRHGQADGRADAHGDPWQRVAPTDAHEVRGDDTDDERGLQAFAQHEEKRRGHGRSGSE